MGVAVGQANDLIMYHLEPEHDYQDTDFSGFVTIGRNNASGDVVSVFNLPDMTHVAMMIPHLEAAASLLREKIEEEYYREI